jgi:peroxiredoxin (alkyl hydroperoxide reductase subunit C)
MSTLENPAMTNSLDIPASAQPGLPRLGMLAPQFEVATTHGTLRLEDFKGSWLILFSHPADFTPVCTTEFIGFAQIHSQLRAMNCELMGLSIDSVFSHIAWVRNIEQKMGAKIDFPIIADLDREVATKYGMISPGESKTEASRCVFVIDPKQVIRAMIYYPLTTGRNMDEILRLIQALQTTDEHLVATPANWRPGDKVILPPPQTQDAAAERVEAEGLECIDWYFCKKEL